MSSRNSSLVAIWFDEPAFTLKDGFRRYDDRVPLIEIMQYPSDKKQQIVGFSCGRRALTTCPDLTFFPNLQFLELDENNLKAIPNLASLQKLEVLKVNKNFITDLSDVEKLTKLIRLDIDFNELAKLPELGHLKSLRTIHALPNPLQYASSLPPKSQIDDRSVDFYEKLAVKMEKLPLYNGQEITYSTRDNKSREAGASHRYLKNPKEEEMEKLIAENKALKAENQALKQQIEELTAPK